MECKALALADIPKAEAFGLQFMIVVQKVVMKYLSD